jgi:hypothetical protein
MSRSDRELHRVIEAGRFGMAGGALALMGVWSASATTVGQGLAMAAAEHAPHAFLPIASVSAKSESCSFPARGQRVLQRRQRERVSRAC